MRIDIVTVFPEMIASALDHSIVKRAMERGLVDIRVVNLRDYAPDRHRTTDDVPYGGGGGMIMKIEPIARALEDITGVPVGVPSRVGTDPTEATLEVTCGGIAETATTSASVPSTGQDAASVSSHAPRPRIVLTDPRGPVFTQARARQWAAEPHLILLCGHYEGVDERVRRYLVTDEVSIGDYILTGGELPALVIVDALTRLQAGALGDAEAPDKDTFAEDLLEYPHYTRPQCYNGWEVPGILVSGHHAQIEKWRRWHQLQATQTRRPDLFARVQLTPQDIKLLHAAEPTAPPDKKALLRSARASARPDRAVILTEETSEEETSDGIGKRSHS